MTEHALELIMGTRALLAVAIALSPVVGAPAPALARSGCFRPLEDFEVKLLVSLVPGVHAGYLRGEIVKLGDEAEMPGLDRAL